MLTISTDARYGYTRRVILLPILAVTCTLFAIKAQAQQPAAATPKPAAKQVFTLVPGNKSPQSSRLWIHKTGVAKSISDAPDSTAREIQSNTPLYVLDGVIISEEHASAINASDILSLSVLKGQNATAIYGNKGKNGVVVILSKAANSTPWIKK